MRDGQHTRGSPPLVRPAEVNCREPGQTGFSNAATMEQLAGAYLLSRSSGQPVAEATDNNGWLESEGLTTTMTTASDAAEGPRHGQNLTKLRNVMCTWVWQHLDTGYVQGMCDLLAPLLVVLEDEWQAYACFSRLMLWMLANFPTPGPSASGLVSTRFLASDTARGGPGASRPRHTSLGPEQAGARLLEPEARSACPSPCGTDESRPAGEADAVALGWPPSAEAMPLHRLQGSHEAKKS
ncbi:unnamed protein product, partial [Protopolystoma xenopodis]